MNLCPASTPRAALPCTHSLPPSRDILAHHPPLKPSAPEPRLGGGEGRAGGALGLGRSAEGGQGTPSPAQPGVSSCCSPATVTINGPCAHCAAAPSAPGPPARRLRGAAPGGTWGRHRARLRGLRALLSPAAAVAGGMDPRARCTQCPRGWDRTQGRGTRGEGDPRDRHHLQDSISHRALREPGSFICIGGPAPSGHASFLPSPAESGHAPTTLGSGAEGRALPIAPPQNVPHLFSSLPRPLSLKTVCRPRPRAGPAPRSAMAAGVRAPPGPMARPLWRLLSPALAALSLLSLPSLPVSAGSLLGPEEQLVAAAVPRWGWQNVSCPACRVLFGALDLALQVGTGDRGVPGRVDTGTAGREERGTNRVRQEGGQGTGQRGQGGAAQGQGQDRDRPGQSLVTGRGRSGLVTDTGPGSEWGQGRAGK